MKRSLHEAENASQTVPIQPLNVLGTVTIYVSETGATLGMSRGISRPWMNQHRTRRAIALTNGAEMRPEGGPIVGHNGGTTRPFMRAITMRGNEIIEDVLL